MLYLFIYPFIQFWGTTYPDEPFQLTASFFNFFGNFFILTANLVSAAEVLEAHFRNRSVWSFAFAVFSLSGCNCTPSVITFCEMPHKFSN